jgi:hypothetical protein
MALPPIHLLYPNPPSKPGRKNPGKNDTARQFIFSIILYSYKDWGQTTATPGMVSEGDITQCYSLTANTPFTCHTAIEITYIL